MKEQVAEWLRTIFGVSDVSPVTLTIGKQSWEGALYKQDDAWGYYLVGDPPRHTKTCYQFTENGRDWYLSAYQTDPVYLSECKEFHPFGKNWMMRAWTCKTKIDAHTEYRRMVVRINVG